LTVRAEPDPAKNIYLRLVTLNGKKLDKPWFRHEEIAKGGELVFEMSGKPLPWPISE
jgi:putative alpha-1,2-mannosidase